MRIALMTNNYKPVVGGVPISIERLARGLKELGHEVTIFAPTYKEQLEMKKETHQENVFRYSTCLNHFIGGIVLPNPFDLRIEREFRKQRYDVIHVHHPMLIGRTAVYLSRKYCIPLVFTYHTRYEQYVRSYTKGILKMDRVMPLYLRSFLRHCDFVFAPTAGMQKYLTDTCKVRAEKTGVLPTGIEQESFEIDPESGQKIRRQYGAEKIPFLLTVSRMAAEKNVAFLLESLVRVKEEYGKPFRMLMVGDGPDREVLQKRSQELGLGEIVIFAGAVPNAEIAPYFKAADAFLFASKTETQGIVVLEAFAGATPVIAVKASGVEDLVDDGINGILTKEDSGEYAEKVTEFLNRVAPSCQSRMEDICMMSSGSISDNFCQAEKGQSRRQMSANAFQKAFLYREEAVALKAVHYYNSVIAENAMQKKRNIRLLPAG